MKHRAALLFALAAAGSAHAARNGVLLAQDGVPTIKVESSNGNSYDHVEGSTYAIALRISGHCPSNHSVVEAAARAVAWPGSDGSADLGDLRRGDREFGNRLIRVPEAMTPIPWHPNWKQRVIEACNADLGRQMNAGGKTARQIMSRPWTLKGVTLDQADGRLLCRNDGRTTSNSYGETYTVQRSIKVDVQCARYMAANDFAAERKPLSPTDDLSNGVHVVQAHLTALPKVDSKGTCGLTLSAVIETDVANTRLTLAYRNNKGGMTPARSVRTDHSKTVMFTDFIDFRKLNGPAMTAGAGQSTGGFAAATSAKQFSGYYQMVGKSLRFDSNLAEFAFDCPKPSEVNGLTTPPRSKPTAAPTRKRERR